MAAPLDSANSEQALLRQALDGGATNMVQAIKKRRGAEVSNDEVAASLAETAKLLESQGANPFRVAAYRRAAETVRGTDRPLGSILAERGEAGLAELPGIGQSLAKTIDQCLRTGRMSMLEGLRSGQAPHRIFTTVADVGPKLAARIHQELGIATLAELEAACWDGRLARVPGMGQKRIQAIRESLAGRFQRPSPAERRLERRDSPAESGDEPSVAELLDVDAEYRRRAEHDRLPRIAPRRFNPEGQAWLPVLRTERNGRAYRAMFSNTAHAHEYGATRDWVILFGDEKQGGGQWTVITSRLGRLKGRRLVRGREAECAAWYAAQG